MSDNNENDKAKAFNIERAELYETLGHPTRISILQSLGQMPMSFSELKRRTNMESSGNLAFHLGKLNNLVRTNNEGNYALTDEGREALRILEATEKASSPGKPEPAVVPFKMRIGSRLLGRKVIAALLLVVLVVVIGTSFLSGVPLVNAQNTLNATYNNFTVNYWKAAAFNNSAGKELAFFALALRTSGNQSQAPVDIGVTWGPNVQSLGSNKIPLYIDSVKMTFSSDNFANWPSVSFIPPTQTGIFPNPQVSRQTSRIEVVSFDNLGLSGKATNLVELWFQLLGVGPSSDLNHTVTLTVDLKAHAPNSKIIGQSFSGEAVFPITVEPNGDILVSNQVISMRN